VEENIWKKSMTWKKTLVGVLVLPLLSGCGKDGPGIGQIGGAVLGGATGGYVGSTIGGGRGRVIATALGAVLGTVAGSQLGAYFDKKEQTEIEDTTLDAFDSGASRTWKSSKHNAKYMVRPGRLDDSGCREYKTVILIDGKRQEAYGRACKDEFGQWRIEK
jgi:surface antigen